MALTENTYTGNGSQTTYSFNFPYLQESDVKVSLNSADTTAFTFASATSIQFNNAPANGVAIRIYRTTDNETLRKEFYAGSTIRADDLNNNALQLLYVSQETENAVNNAAVGAIPDGSIGSSKLATNAVTTGKISDSAVNGVKIADSSITNAKVDPAAAIAGTKVSPDFGSQNVTTSGNITVTNQADIRFGEATANGTNYVGFQAPSSIASDLIWTLPNVDATIAGYALVSNAAGVLSWGRAGGAQGGAGDDIFYENSQTVNTNYTISTNKNAMTAGPVTIASGVTVTVPSGSSWVIV